jgi:hypothetical protein
MEPLFFFFHLFGWDPYWLKIIMFFCFYCTELCLYVMFFTWVDIFMGLWLILFAQHSRREQEQELWATRVLLLQVSFFFHFTYLATCDKNLSCKILWSFHTIILMQALFL